MTSRPPLRDKSKVWVACLGSASSCKAATLARLFLDLSFCYTGTSQVHGIITTEHLCLEQHFQLTFSMILYLSSSWNFYRLHFLSRDSCRCLRRSYLNRRLSSALVFESGSVFTRWHKTVGSLLHCEGPYYIESLFLLASSQQNSVCIVAQNGRSVAVPGQSFCQ